LCAALATVTLITVQTPESLTKVVQATGDGKTYTVSNMKSISIHKKALNEKLFFMNGNSFYNDPTFYCFFLEQIPSKTKIQLLL
jgi:hypothetical protein